MGQRFLEKNKHRHCSVNLLGRLLTGRTINEIKFDPEARASTNDSFFYLQVPKDGKENIQCSTLKSYRRRGNGQLTWAPNTMQLRKTIRFWFRNLFQITTLYGWNNFLTGMNCSKKIEKEEFLNIHFSNKYTKVTFHFSLGKLKKLYQRERSVLMRVYKREENLYSRMHA